MRIMVLSHRPHRGDNEYVQRVEPILRSYASPGTEVDLVFPDDSGSRLSGPGSAHLGYYYDTAALVQKTVWAEQNGYDAVLQSNNFEPGVEACRLAVRIPVLGMGRTTMLAAANIADKVAVTVPLDGYFVLARRLLQAWGVSPFVAGLRSMSLEAVPSGDQVAVERPVIFQRALETMKALVHETGAEAVVPLGGAIIPYIVDPRDLEKELGVPVLNPKAVTIRTAEMYVSLGMSQSPITYPKAAV